MEALYAGGHYTHTDVSNAFLRIDLESGAAQAIRIHEDVAQSVMSIEIENNALTTIFGIHGIASTGNMMTMVSVCTTGNVIDVAADSLTTGSIADFVSNSADTGTRTLVNIHNDNAAAVNVTPLKVTQDAVVSTNFKLVADLGGMKIFVSDQTSPNTALTAPEGSLCLNGSATGQILWNTDGATAWTVLA